MIQFVVLSQRFASSDGGAKIPIHGESRLIAEVIQASQDLGLVLNTQLPQATTDAAKQAEQVGRNYNKQPIFNDKTEQVEQSKGSYIYM